MTGLYTNVSHTCEKLFRKCIKKTRTDDTYKNIQSTEIYLTG